MSLPQTLLWIFLMLEPLGIVGQIAMSIGLAGIWSIFAVPSLPVTEVCGQY